MPESLFAVYIVECKNLNLAVLVKGCAQIAVFAVYLAETCSFIKSRAETLSHIHDGNAFFKLFERAVLKCNFYHKNTSVFYIIII